MTTITSFNGMLNNVVIPLVPGTFDGTVVETTPTRWTFESPGLFIAEFTGSFTGYDASGVPTGGVITGYTYTQYYGDGTPWGATVSDFSLPVADYLAFVAADDPDGALAIIWAGAQTIIGLPDETNLLRGWGGDDIMTGGDLADYLEGGEGYDQVSGGGGDDIIVYSNHREARIESLYGDDGLDTLQIEPGGVEDAFINLDVGFIRMDGVLSAKIYSFERASGGDGDDRLVGTSGANTLDGKGGADTISAGAGNDLIYGGDGDDYARGGDGQDYLSGGSGLDLLLGEAGDDIMFGLDGRDRLYGEAGADTLSGGNGTDLLDGGGEADILRGGGWGDTLVGGDGDDRLYGEREDDILTGGAGADRFSFNTTNGGRDVITDFEDGVDTIHVNLAGVSGYADLDVIAVGGDAVVTFPDGSSVVLTGAAGQIGAADFVFGGA